MCNISYQKIHLTFCQTLGIKMRIILHYINYIKLSKSKQFRQKHIKPSESLKRIRVNPALAELGHFGPFHFDPDWTLRTFLKMTLQPLVKTLRSLVKFTLAPWFWHLPPRPLRIIWMKEQYFNHSHTITCKCSKSSYSNLFQLIYFRRVLVKQWNMFPTFDFFLHYQC